MRIETRFILDDPEKRVIHEDISVILDGTPRMGEALKMLIDGFMDQEGWEKL